MNQNTLQLSFILLLFSTLVSAQDSPLKLWYTNPAPVSEADVKDNPTESGDIIAGVMKMPVGWEDDPNWLSALPLGNGSLGLMVFGGVNRERIQLNEESMWSGSPFNEDDNPEAFKFQAEIQQLLFDGKYKEATELTNKTQITKGKGSGNGNGAEVPFGCFQTMGELWIDNGKTDAYENYQRELDLEDAMVRINYTQNGVHYKREIFTSQPNQVMVARFTASKPGSISFSATMNRLERFTTTAEDHQLVMQGALSNGKGGDGLKYITRLKAVNKNGTLSYEGSKLTVKNADEVILYLSASTDYLLKYPDYKGRDYKKISQQNIDNAINKEWDFLLKAHLAEYQNYFKRVHFDITPNTLTPIPTNERLEQFKADKKDLHLQELLFQYGRYLLISASRPGTLPANLQGIWADKIQTPWNGDYHTDVNVEMNYWLAETTNLSEMHLPLFDLIASLVEPGKKTAQIQYHKKGWVVHPITNVWGYTSPGEKASWGMHTGAGAWISTHILEHYNFTKDVAFLTKMYPVLKESVIFYMDWLVEHPKTGKLVSGPAVSPENTFIAPDGSKSQISMGPAHDQQVIWQLFSDFLLASEVLKKDDTLIKEVAIAKERLAGPKIGSDGRLMEWEEEFPEVEPGHRHISHLFALHPGHQITLEHSPKLAEAAKKSLDFRINHGGGHTGWSAAWLVNQYARLHDAEKAKKSLDVVISKSTATNLFGQHPPFQMDANFGTTAGIAEMLLQSHTGSIELLPALPAAWHTGTIKGLRARGGYTVNMYWKNGKLVTSEINADNMGEVELKYGSTSKKINLKAGETYIFQPK